jgi:hypothetical protein
MEPPKKPGSLSYGVHQKLLLYDFVYAVKIVLKSHILDRNFKKVSTALVGPLHMA